MMNHIYKKALYDESTAHKKLKMKQTNEYQLKTFYTSANLCEMS